ncbi:hypothetical protein L7F22_039744 [Adiantum nelumboides]|nr:hypothetical protein [Adiantum nelumboides]
MTPMDWYKKWTDGPLIDPESELASDEDNDRGQGQSTLTPSIRIWFQLEYWKHLNICHFLNPIHIFKNVGHSLRKHLTGMKDTEQARNDLKERICKSDLWPQVDEESRRKEWITSKEIDISSIVQKKRECIELLCLMEKELPTSFFDIQVHVLIHLVDEIEISGVVSTRWMFWVERFMGVLKGLVRQRT